MEAHLHLSHSILRLWCLESVAKLVDVFRGENFLVLGMINEDPSSHGTEYLDRRERDKEKETARHRV